MEPIDKIAKEYYLNQIKYSEYYGRVDNILWETYNNLLCDKRNSKIDIILDESTK